MLELATRWKRTLLAGLLVMCGDAATWSAGAIAADQKILVVPTSSYAHNNDGRGGKPLPAICDGKEAANSDDHKIPRFTFWSHRGTKEWIAYEFSAPARVSSVDVYWFDDKPRNGGCRVPGSWRLFYQRGYDWLPVKPTSKYETKPDTFNSVAFEPVVTTGLRIEVQQQTNWSSGILEWKINGTSPTLDPSGRTSGAVGAQRHGELLQSRLALAALNATKLATEDSKAAPRRLTELTAKLEELQSQLGGGSEASLKQWKQLANDVARVQARYQVETLIKRIHDFDEESGVRLMIQLDWLRQDAGDGQRGTFPELAKSVIDALLPADRGLADRYQALSVTNARATDARWMALYLEACRQRRAERMGAHVSKFRQLIFTKHHDIGGQHYAYTEDVSDSPYNDNNPFPSSGKLCLLEMDGFYGRTRTLIDEPRGLIRDPTVSYDGERVLFARRTSMTDDDYHLYEMNVADEAMRQITFGDGVADYEPAYLPNGDLVFNSSRCQQIVDCWWADVSNLYTCDADGKYLRRLSFDQVHTNYPTVMPDGRVIYTRWDYNDRGQLFPQPLFQMNPDGTNQTEFYGNNSWFPTTILHARGIPGAGTSKVVCVLSGHHTYQKGKLAIIDPNRGRQEASGVQLIAPRRHTEAVRIDKYGYTGEQFQYPYPLSETEFLVTYSPIGSKQGRAAADVPFGIYFITIDGQRELLVADPGVSCNQCVPLASRPLPPTRSTKVDYAQREGTFLLHDVYHGPGLQGVPRGTVKNLRVVALEFRAAGVGRNGNHGPAGGAMVSTPISINGAWDVKRVLGTAKVYEDGSAAFKVPARTPVYFQALDDENHVVQTMRSWSTLQPGEVRSCVGCHEGKHQAPPAHTQLVQALKAGPQTLKSSFGNQAGFSFAKLVQPILDRHCVECHSRETVADETSTISLEGKTVLDKNSLKHWSDAYRALADPKIVNWPNPQTAPPMLPPYHAGAAKSRLIELLKDGHEGVTLRPGELDVVSCWIDLGIPYSGAYTEGLGPENAATYDRYLTKRKASEARERKQINALLQGR
ncbi:MAG: hypothetical protein CMJ48_11070 [Planctomycetaceae bacterium]|nr:hypothetical protein [Planctomycetaceae bacterium]